MKSLLKKFIISILSIRAKAILKSSECQVVVVMGEGKDRKFFKEVFAEHLTAHEISVLDSLPGYNHTLGANLTILRQHSGGNSVLQWLRILFDQYKPIKEDLVVLEFAYTGDQKELQFLRNILSPDVIIASDELSFPEVEGCLAKNALHIIPESVTLDCDSVKKYGGEEGSDLELVASRESDNGLYFEYQIDHEMYSINLHHFGMMYIIPTMIADYYLHKFKPHGSSLSSQKT